MTIYAVLCSCTSRPCLMCAHEGGKERFLCPVYTGFAAHSAKSFFERGARTADGSAPRHRYDVAELRADGWPLCPWCGDDELYSLAIPASAEKLAGCYRCGTSAARASADPAMVAAVSAETCNRLHHVSTLAHVLICWERDHGDSKPEEFRARALELAALVQKVASPMFDLIHLAQRRVTTLAEERAALRALDESCGGGK